MALTMYCIMVLLVSSWLGMRLVDAAEPLTSLLPPAHPDQPNNVPENQLVYIVQLPGKPVVAAFGDVYNNTGKAGTRKGRINRQRIQEAHNYSANLSAAQNTFLSKNLNRGSYRKIASFTHCLNAVIVRLTNGAQVNLLKTGKGVKRVERDTKLVSHTTHTPAFLGLDILSSGSWSLAGGGPDGAGQDVVIGVVDTGVTPAHPSLSDDLDVPYGPVPSSFLGRCDIDVDSFPAGSCNRKLIGAQYFAASAIAYNFLDSLDFVSPLDGNGHGTHTSATAGGNGNINVTVQDQAFGIGSGIAPRARLSTYKCIFRFGGILSDCIAALEQAVLDGVNVINLSLGPSSPPSGITFLSAFDIAMLQAVKSGIVVVQSAGNYGPGAGTLSSFSPWIITVGAAAIDRTYPVYLTLGNGPTLTGSGYSGGDLPSSLLISSADAALPNSTSGYNPTDCQVADDLDENLVAGNILLCFYSEDFQIGASVVSQVAITAQQLNAVGFVLVASNSSIIFPIYYDPLPFLIPGVFLTTLASSQIVANYYNANPSTAAASISIPSTYSADFTSVAPIVSGFSSRGPTPSNADAGDTGDVLKPDLVAPGNQIWSAWTTDGVDLPYWNSNFASRSGTSQAAPHVSGVVALIKQKHPTWSPAAIQSALVTSGKKSGSNGQPIRAQYPANDPDRPLGPATPFDMGGGFLNPSAALDPGLIFDRGYQDYINFLCTVQGANPQDILILTGTACNISAGAKASDLNTPSITIANLRGSRQVIRTVTSVGTGTEVYTGTVVAPTGVSVALSPSTFTISSGSTTSFTAVFKVTRVVQEFTFGRITWTGDAGHIVTIPISTNPSSFN